MPGQMPFPPPYREYPPQTRRVLGTRYCTTCETGDLDNPALLWSDEPFTETVVRERLTELGWDVIGVRLVPSIGSWVADLRGGSPWSRRQPTFVRYVGFIGRDCSRVSGFGRWRWGEQRLVLFSAQNAALRVGYASRLLYDKYDQPNEHVVTLTDEQAARLAASVGCRLPGDEEAAAALAADDLRRQASKELHARLYARRAARFAADAARVRADGRRLADAPPERQAVFYHDERKRVVAEIDAISVDLNEWFPLTRFLVGNFRDRDDRYDTHGDFDVYCNRVVLRTDPANPAERLELALALWIQSSIIVRGSVLTPYCPAEGHPLDDAEFRADLARETAARPWQASHLSSRILPVSAGHLRIVGRPPSRTPAPGPGAAPEPAVVRRIVIALAFPTGVEHVATPGWEGDAFYWERFLPSARWPPEAPTNRSSGLDLFVPADIDVIKPVRARFLIAPAG